MFQKIISTFLVLTALMLTTISCNDSEVKEPEIGEVKFSYAEEATGGRHSRIKEEGGPAFVRVSINGNNGNLTETIPLLAFGTDYISEGLKLTIGDYMLTEFMVLDDASHVLYAAPLQGSELSELVSKPLPIDFKVSVRDAAVVRPEVIAVSDLHTPEDFGYVSFGFDIVDLPKPPPNAPTDYREYVDKKLERRVQYKYGKHGLKQIGDTTYGFLNNGESLENITYKSNGLIDKVHIQANGGIDEIATYFYDAQDRLNKVEVVQKNGFMRKKLLVNYPQSDQLLVFHTHYSIAGYSNTRRMLLTYSNDNVVHATEHYNYSNAPDNWILFGDKDFTYSDKLNYNYVAYKKLYMGLSFQWHSKNAFTNFAPQTNVQIFNEQGFLKQETTFYGNQNTRDRFVQY